MLHWEYFNNFEAVTDKYLPAYGEGETMATQIVTAVCKLVYKFYNDGDVFDNTYSLPGWANDLSSYANWLERYTGAGYILYGIEDVSTDEEYEELLIGLAKELLDERYLELMNKKPKKGSIYDQKGPFKYEECWDDDEEDEYEVYWDDDDEEEEYF